MEEIFKASSEYVGSSLFAGKLPGGARWVKIDLGRVTQALGLNMQQLAGQSNPAQFLQYLRATAGKLRALAHDPSITPGHAAALTGKARELSGLHDQAVRDRAATMPSPVTSLIGHQGRCSF